MATGRSNIAPIDGSTKTNDASRYRFARRLAHANLRGAKSVTISKPTFLQCCRGKMHSTPICILAGLRPDFYCIQGLFKVELQSPLHRICRGMQKFLRSQVRPCEDQFVDELHLTVGDVWKNVGNHTDSNSTVQSESVPVFEEKAPRNEANGEDTAEPLFKCFMENCAMPSGHWDRCFNCSAHVCSAHRRMCQYNEPCPERFCPGCSSNHWSHRSSDKESSDSDFAVEVQDGSVYCSNCFSRCSKHFDGVCPGCLDGCKRMSDIWAKDLQADAAAWKRHVSQLRIDERYAGIYFIATNNLYSFRDWLV